jgi:release factor H-coupled RctB family protein
MAANIKTFFTDTTWIEGSAIQQLERVASLPGMVSVAGFWAKKISGLEKPWDGDTAACLAEFGAEPDEFGASLGTIGGGNHFAELLKVTEVFDESHFRLCGLKQHCLSLLVHSGSRALGERLLRSHVDVHRDGSLKAGSEEAERYLKAHDHCVKWAQANRFLIATRFLFQISDYYGYAGDWCHNSITPVESAGNQLFLNRKGVAPSDKEYVFIPGSRGTCSYLVKPVGDHAVNLWSVAHGAGRKWGRNECEGRLRDKYSPDSMKKTKLGSYVICEDRDLLYEEAPQAYKDIDSVIADMVGFGLITIVARFAPVLTYKVRGK